MKGFWAVFRKETASFFVSPVAYAVMTIFLLISGFLFRDQVLIISKFSLQAANNPMFADRLNPTEAVMQPQIQTMAVLLLFMMPLLTMRLFAEEKKSGTMELLLTYPITDAAVLAGKFLSASFMLLVMIGMTLAYPLQLLRVSDLEIGTTLSGYLGLLLTGLAFMAMGAFISSLTENQIIAAAVTFGAALLFWVVRATAMVSGSAVGSVLRQISILDHLEPFIKGVMSLADLSFFVLFIAFFLFMTVRSLESHRWRG